MQRAQALMALLLLRLIMSHSTGGDEKYLENIAPKLPLPFLMYDTQLQKCICPSKRLKAKDLVL
jgi:hypothetical protein